MDKSEKQIPHPARNAGFGMTTKLDVRYGSRPGRDRCHETVLQKVGDAEIGMNASAAAESDLSAKNHFAGEEEREPTAKSLMQIGKIQIAATDSNFAGVVEEEESDGANDAAVVFGLD